MKWQRSIFFVITLLFGILSFLSSVFQIYNTIIEKAGLWGSMHMYYSLGKWEYILFHISIAIVSLVLLIWSLAGLQNLTQKRFIKRLTILCIVCISSLLLQHFFLESFFIGKA